MSLINFQKKIGTKPDGDFGKDTLKKAKAYYKLTNEQTAHFFGQVSHETGRFKVFEENLRYSASGLRKTFGKYFPNQEIALAYSMKANKIANKVYGGRMGNGDENSGDGWKYRGRGALQLTGKSNYKAFSEFVEDGRVVDNPDLVITEYCFESAIFYFTRHKIWDKSTVINNATIANITRIINGGLNGLDDRMALTKKYYKLLTEK